MNDIVPYQEELNPYLDLVTWQHQKPKYLSTIATSISAPTELQSLLGSIPQLFDIDYAVGDQLDILGQWIGISRYLDILIENVYFSWDADTVGWDSGLWTQDYEPTTALARLDDEHYRFVLKGKIVANMWDGTIPGAYEAWNTLFYEDDYNIVIQNGMAAAASVLTWDGEPIQSWDKSSWERYLHQRTNWIRNSVAAGVDVGDLFLPTYWRYYSNWTLQIVETLVREYVNLIHIQFSGSTPTDATHLYFEEYDQVAILPHDANDWTFSVYFGQYFQIEPITGIFVDLVFYDHNHHEIGVVSEEIFIQSDKDVDRHQVTCLYEDRPEHTVIISPRLRFDHPGGALITPPPPTPVIWNPAYSASSLILQGTLAESDTDNLFQTALDTVGATYKYYVEFRIERFSGGANATVGIGIGTNSVLSLPNTSSNWWLGLNNSFGWYNNGWASLGWTSGIPGEFDYFAFDGSYLEGLDAGFWDGTVAGTQPSVLPSFTAGDTISLAVDPLNLRVWGRVNGGFWNGDDDADPATNVGGLSIAPLAGILWPGVTLYRIADQIRAAFASRDWNYPAPLGFRSLQAEPALTTGYEIAVGAPQLEMHDTATKWIPTHGDATVVWEHLDILARVNGGMHMIYGLVAPYQDPPPGPDYFTWDNYDYFSWDLGYDAVEWELSYSSPGVIVSGTLAQGTLHGVSQTTLSSTGVDFRYYVELAITGAGQPDQRMGVGVGDSTVLMLPGASIDPEGWWLGQGASIAWTGLDGNVWLGGAQIATWASYGTGDTVCLAIDPTSGHIWGRVNLGNWNNNPLADPASNIGGFAIPSLIGRLFPGVTLWDEAVQVVGHFVSEEWLYTAPAGFAALQIEPSNTLQGWESGLWDASPVSSDSLGWNTGVWDVTPTAITAPEYDAVTMALFAGGYLDLRPAGVTMEYCLQSLVGTPFFAWDTSEETTFTIDYFSWDETDLQGWDIGSWDTTQLSYTSLNLRAPPTYVAGWENGAWPNFIDSSRYEPLPNPQQRASHAPHTLPAFITSATVEESRGL